MIKTNYVIKIVLVLWQAFSLSPLALAQVPNNDCVLKLDELTPILAVHAKSIKKATLPKFDAAKQKMTEELTLNDGTKITVEQGGCAHYAYGFTYENSKISERLKASDPLKVAIDLVNKTPLREEGANSKANLFLRALGKLSWPIKLTNGRIDIPCGDATCTLDISVLDKVIINYDMVL